MMLRIAAVATIVLGLSLAMLGRARAQTVQIPGNVPDFQMTGTAPYSPANTLEMSIRLAWQNPADLQALLIDLQNPASPRFHKFVTYSQFSAAYAPSQAQVQSLISWLSGQGFQVASYPLQTPPYQGVTYPAQPMFIDFTGTVAQAETAFQISIVTLGTTGYFENTALPSIPAEFAGLVAYIGGLDNLGRIRKDGLPPSFAPSPAPTPGPPATNPFTPSDFYTYYSEGPVLKGGNGGTASNDCIAILATNDFNDTAFQTFASTYALPATLPTRRLVDITSPAKGTANGKVSLDTEWSHAVAPNTPQTVYEINTGEQLAAVKGFDAMVVDNSCSVIASMFGPGCDRDPAQYMAYGLVFQEAAAQGQTVFQGAGADNAAGRSLLQNGQQLNCYEGGSGQPHPDELATSPDITAVGGTQFTPTYDGNGDDISVVGEIEESVWNNGFINPGNNGWLGTGGGVSGIYAQPTWQQSVGAALQQNQFRLIPDVAMGSSSTNPGFSTYEINGNGQMILAREGGTAAMWAGVSRLIANGIANPRLGNIDPLLYAQAGDASSNLGIVDITTGDNTIPGFIVGYEAMAGYDLVSGWGVPNIAEFVPAFAQALNPGAQATASASKVSGRVGETVTAGTFTIKNTLSVSESLSQVSVTVANPQLFSGLSLESGGGSSTQESPVTSITTFSFSPAVSIAAGGSVEFSLKATLQNPNLAADRSYVAYAAIIGPDAGELRGGAGGLGLVLMLVGACLGAVRKRRVWMLGLLLVVMAAAQVGCGGSSGNSGARLGSSAMSIGKNAISVNETDSGGIVGVTDLPVTIGKVTVF